MPPFCSLLPRRAPPPQALQIHLFPAFAPSRRLTARSFIRSFVRSPISISGVADLMRPRRRIFRSHPSCSDGPGQGCQSSIHQSLLVQYSPTVSSEIIWQSLCLQCTSPDSFVPRPVGKEKHRPGLLVELDCTQLPRQVASKMEKRQRWRQHNR